MDVRAATEAWDVPRPAQHGDEASARAGDLIRMMRRSAAAFMIATIMGLPCMTQAAHLEPHPLLSDVEVESLVDDEGAVGLLTLPNGVRHGHSRIPAVVLVSDGAGPDQRTFRYIEQLRHAGIAALEVQLYEMSTDGVAFPAPHDRNQDAARLLRAVQALRRVRDIEFSVFAAIGFGRGAHPLVLGDLRTNPSTDLVARVLLYPGCKEVGTALRENAAPSRAPVLIVHGDADSANMQEDCDGLAQQFAQDGVTSRVIRYRGATYGWDIPAMGMSGTAYVEGPDGRRVRTTPWDELSDMSAAQAISFVAAELVRASW